MIKTHWSQFEYNDLLHPLNVYKIPEIQHEAVDFWVVDEISPSQILFWKYWEYVPLIFRNYKKLKRTKKCMIKKFFFVKCAINLNDDCRLIWRKTKKCPLNITLSNKFFYIITIKSIKTLSLQKNLTRKMIKISISHRIKAKGKKNYLLWNKKSTLTFNNRQNFFFFLKIQIL